MYEERKRIFKREIVKLDLSLIKSPILEIASGTGFYTKILSILGAKNIVGSDITKAVVNKLSDEFPEFVFYKQDIGGVLIDELRDRKFKLITAIDMLFHITDDIRYQDAFFNVYHLLNEDGYFVFTENLPTFDKAGEIHAIRSKEKVFECLEKANFKVLKVLPMTYFLNAPVSKNKFLLWVFKFQTKILFRYNSPRYKEKAGDFLGLIFYLFDWVILPFVKNGPSNHLIICTKKR